MPDHSRYAVVDIGSNSVKFIVADASGGKLVVLRERSCPTRLAEGASTSGQLSEAAIERTLAMLSELGAEARSLGAERIHAVATSAVRDAANRKAFVKGARTALKGTVHIYTGEEEAQGVFAGVSSDPVWANQPIMIFDVGGGSAEWIQGRDLYVDRELSLPLGAVRLRERFVPEYPFTADGIAAMRAALHDQLEDALAAFALGSRTLVGTGGSMTTLAAMEQEMVEWDIAQLDRYALTRQQIARFIERLTDMPLQDIARLPGLPPKRTDLILPAAILIETVMETISASRLVVSLRGLRYGVLMRLLKEDGHPLRAVRLERDDAPHGSSAAGPHLDSLDETAV